MFSLSHLRYFGRTPTTALEPAGYCLCSKISKQLFAILAFISAASDRRCLFPIDYTGARPQSAKLGAVAHFKHYCALRATLGPSDASALWYKAGVLKLADGAGSDQPPVPTQTGTPKKPIARANSMKPPNA
jgi:hypothetical protein